MNSGFLEKYHGYLKNLLRWDELDRLWDRLRQAPDGVWFAYATGESPPQQPLDAEQLARVIGELDLLLRTEHKESYCGIVYVDDPDAPSLVKIYDPNNLGSVCGSSFGPPPLPGWVLSTLPPTDLKAVLPQPEGRRRWWQRLLARGRG